MVVIPQCVCGNASGGLWRPLAIVERHAYDRAGAVEQQPRVIAQMHMMGHIVHRGMHSRVEPVLVDVCMAAFHRRGSAYGESGSSLQLQFPMQKSYCGVHFFC